MNGRAVLVRRLQPQEWQAYRAIRLRALADAPDAFGSTLWVAPEARGRGVAAALLDEALEWARSRGTRLVHLGVNHANAGALRLYRRAGFRPIGEPYPMREGAPHMEQEMRLLLSGQENTA